MPLKVKTIGSKDLIQNNLQKKVKIQKMHIENESNFNKTDCLD